ncbi:MULTISPECIES: hypothetical protein [Streptomyces]|uniref:DUF4190 domain-containing protein n=1 Tax=Streptomyces lasiicapitis TaxID=1923961 RepID=A0ABQ2MMB3_9ACTN|nr:MULTISPECIES: hypothetical protein [Streptomyces]QIB47945.1 hypothetical protein G3H79_37675 [Streptomyces aureoverticillatus]GGO54169.1 hypothetical protein GCM10012286_63300 [Streptomyces lasiicapitis]
MAFLAFFLPAPVRVLPLCLIGPAGIGAVVTGFVDLRRMRGREGADPYRARTGIALGTAAIVLPLAVLLWLLWAMSQI